MASTTTHAAGKTVLGGDAKARKGRAPRKNTTPSILVKICLWLYALIAVFPLLLMFSNSFRSTKELVTDPLGLPTSPTVEGYVSAWTEASFATYFVNSILVTVGSVFLSTAVSVLASYALARWTFFGKHLMENVFLAGLMIPAILAMLPIFYLMDDLRLIDSHWSLIAIYAANGIPFGVFIMTTFFRQLPLELEEAARIDGAGTMAVFFRVMLPLVKPAVATVVVFRFIPIWNDFLFPLILLRSPGKYTLPVGLTRFFGEFSTDWSSLFAGLVVTTAPLILVYVLATKQIVRGLTAGIGK